MAPTVCPQSARLPLRAALYLPLAQRRAWHTAQVVTTVASLMPGACESYLFLGVPSDSASSPPFSSST